MKFVKYLFSNKELPVWVEYDQNTPIYNATIYNFAGGMNSGNDLTGQEIVEAESLYDLDWSNTELLSDKFDTGWVSPAGDFYGCGYSSHELQAKYVHKKTERQLEQLGFIKITKTRRVGWEYIVLTYDKKPTLNQYKWFQKNYIKPNREQVLDNIEFWMKHEKKYFYHKDDQNTQNL